MRQDYDADDREAEVWCRHASTPPDTEVICVELKDTKAPGATATGWRLKWDNDSQDFTDPDYSQDTDQTVYDPNYNWRCIGHDDAQPDTPGARVYCDENNNILSGDSISRQCSGVLQNGGSQGAPGASVTIGSIVPDDVGQSPLTGSNTTLTATMLPDQRAIDGAACRIALMEPDGTWYVDWVQQIARVVYATATVSGGNLTGVTSPVAMDSGQLPSGTFPVVTGGAAVAGPVICFWDESQAKYRALPLSASGIAAVQIDGVNKKLQTQNAGSSTWNDVPYVAGGVTGGACP